MLWPSSANAFGMIACACTSIVFTRLPLITVCLRWPPALGAADASLVALQPWNTIESPLLPVFLLLIYSLLGSNTGFRLSRFGSAVRNEEYSAADCVACAH